MRLTCILSMLTGAVLAAMPAGCHSNGAFGTLPIDSVSRSIDTTADLARVVGAQQIEPQPQSTGGYLQNGPVFEGSRLPGPGPRSATEHALELRAEVERLKIALTDSRKQTAELKNQLADRDATLASAAHEVQLAHSDLDEARTELDRWRKSLVELRVRFRESHEGRNRSLDRLSELLRSIIEEHTRDQRQREQPASPPPVSPALPQIKATPEPSATGGPMPSPQVRSTPSARGRAGTSAVLRNP